MASGGFYMYLHCKPNGDPFYVGKGSGKRAHDMRARNEFHKAVCKKYGAKNILKFVFHCDSEDQAFADEKLAIETLRADGFVLANLTDGGEGISGHKHSIEARAKISASNVGNSYRRGAKLTPEHIAKIIAANTGKQYVLGRTISEAHKARLIQVNTGNKYNLGKKMSPETKANLSKVMMGNKRSLGNIVSAETREKLSIAAKADWAKRKLNKLKD